MFRGKMTRGLKRPKYEWAQLVESKKLYKEQRVGSKAVQYVFEDYVEYWQTRRGLNKHTLQQATERWKDELADSRAGGEGSTHGTFAIGVGLL